MQSSWEMLVPVHITLLFLLTPMFMKSMLISGAKFHPTGVQREARARLYSDLESSPLFQNHLVPLSQDSPVPVRVNLNVYKILELAEPRQVITMAVFYQFEWKDEAFEWDAEDYANVSHMYLPYDRAWHPTPSVVNSAVENFDLFSTPEFLRVDNEGMFEIRGGTLVNTHCHIDLTFFPFDRQTCKLTIGLSGRDIKIFPIASKTELLDGVGEHVSIPAEWHVTKHDVEVYDLQSLPQVVYTVELKRASLYYLLCVLGPMAATTQLTLLVFWIPHASGERISFLMSIYLSSTLYLGFVGDTLPRKDYKFTEAPRMIYFMVFNIAECIMILMATLLSMHIHITEQKAAEQLLAEETDAIRKRLKLIPKSSIDEEKHRRTQTLNVVDLDLDLNAGQRKVCFEDTIDRDENKLFDEKGTEAGKDHSVGAVSRKRRFYEKVKRFLAKTKHIKISCKICAQTLDKLLFLFFLGCSVFFYFFIFGYM